MSFLAGWSAQWWVWLSALAWQLAVVVAMVAALDWLLRRALGFRLPPYLAAGLWLLVPLKLLLPPSLSAPWSLARLLPATGLLPATPATEVEAAELMRVSVALPGHLLVSPQATTAEAAIWQPEPGLRLFLALLWLAGAALLLTMAWLRYRSARQHLLAQPIQPSAVQVAHLEGLIAECRLAMGLRRQPRVQVTGSAIVPALVGCWRPTVVLPQRLLRAEEAQLLRHALLHEMAHLKRRDHWQGLGLIVLTACFWFHPLVWVAAARLAQWSEHCCDDLVLRRSGDQPASYRRSLSRAASMALSPPVRVGALGMQGPVARLAARMDRLNQVQGGFEGQLPAAARSSGNALPDRGSRSAAWLSTAAVTATALILLPLGPRMPSAAWAELFRAPTSPAPIPPSGCMPVRMRVLGAMAGHDKTVQGRSGHGKALPSAGPEGEPSWSAVTSSRPEEALGTEIGERQATIRDPSLLPLQ